jgi:homoserine kinase type II
MAVFTPVSLEEAQTLADQLGLGAILALSPCSGGIENTNYFLDTASGRFVLTVFERLSANELPFYLNLLGHLAHQGVKVPCPQSAEGRQRYREQYVHSIQGKPASVVTRLAGRSLVDPSVCACEQVAQMLAQMHLAALNSPGRAPKNPRGRAWWNEAIGKLLPYLNAEQTALIQAERAEQNALAQDIRLKELPRGLIHADLFRDNVLFDGEVLSGFFDFYFAGVDVWLLDIAICLNDWCIDLSSGQPDPVKEAAFMAAYAQVRPLMPHEHTLLPVFLRAAALRFWTSRLWDWHLPRPATILKAHDPAHFEQLLHKRRAQASALKP